MLIGFNTSNAQTCFENLGEVSGVDMALYTPELNTAACELIETLPTNYQSQFKVFDFGFYALESSMDSDINELWADAITLAQGKSTYYLLIGKVSGESGIYFDYLVDLKLPPIFDPDCADIVTRKVAEIQTIMKSQNHPLDFVQNEKAAMESLHNVGNCEICDDGIDNDGDGFVDCDDFDCLYLQISSQLRDRKNGTTTRSSCTPLSTDELDIFENNEEYIVSWGYESSADVMEEIAAVGIGSCLGAALISVAIDYTAYYIEDYLTKPEYPDFWSVAAVDSVFSNHKFSIIGNALVNCVEGAFPITDRIKRYIDYAFAAAGAFIDVFESEWNKYKDGPYSKLEILRDKINWGVVLLKGSIGTFINMALNEKVQQITPHVMHLWNTNMGLLVAKVDKQFKSFWQKFQTTFNLNPPSGALSTIRTLLAKIPSNKWFSFFGDFGNSLTKLKWFVDDTTKKLNAWLKVKPHPNRVNTNVLGRRVEFDDLPPQWRKENPYTNQEMFDNDSGGFVASHTGHNDYQHEYEMAEAIAKSGKGVKLRDESTPDPNFGNKTPDAEIDGVVHDFKTFNSPNNVNGKVYNHVISAGSRSNAPGVTFNLQGNSATLASVNQGLDDVRLYIQNNGVPSGMAEHIGLVYADGTTKFLTKFEVINGAYF